MNLSLYFPKLLINLAILIPMCLPISLEAQWHQMSKEEYIKNHRNLAIKEMYENGIPASIKLAQAIIESGNGNSRLAREANNHFGVKCHGWNGDIINIDDDVLQECFRKYSDVEQSYRDHSLFLISRPRYSQLFELETTDYAGWANGLKQAGYATNPRYAEILIKTIEDFELYQYDVSKSEILASGKLTEEPLDPENIKDKTTSRPLASNRTLLVNNGRKYIFARKGDSFASLAQEFNIYSFQIWRYNNLDKRDKLKEGDMVYLEKKRNKAASPYHIVARGETMRAISQHYGIKLKKLYWYNRMNHGDEPHVGQALWMQQRKPIE
ncbi:MAG TPA: glucosaminidase domain-containing protein [Bacteroidales bacterium]|jgi:LysM repeat protein|nr:glucosaminidase domain-containing protein [Bacteroidales bacterium]MBP7873942.1 glucosaminidase domain-containing protein [Bacteroidales bacterium]MCZ2283057.1 glucosaminidase domain-containing protein [Bacteroidales bacterium]NLH32596.1 LysM peptidoglycan-binding domain-containing protein [Lentimicrobium sp.]HOG66439.1 glucosaminidase domain-containing protein [Bacteroidales bacterium]